MTASSGYSAFCWACCLLFSGPLPVVSQASLQAAFRSSLNAIAVVRVTSGNASTSSDGGHLDSAASSRHQHAPARGFSKAGSISLAGHNRLQQQHHEEQLYQKLQSAAASHSGLRAGSQSARFFCSSDGGDDAAGKGTCSCKQLAKHSHRKTRLKALAHWQYSTTKTWCAAGKRVCIGALHDVIAVCQLYNSSALAAAVYATYTHVTALTAYQIFPCDLICPVLCLLLLSRRGRC